MAADEAKFTLKLDEWGEVVLILADVRVVLGPKDVAAEEMCRFLREIDFGECVRA